MRVRNVTKHRSPMIGAFEAQHGPLTEWLREHAKDHTLAEVSVLLGYASPSYFKVWCDKHLPWDIEFKRTRGPRRVKKE